MTRANITMYQVYNISCSTGTYNSSKLHSKPYQNRFIWSAEFHFLKVALIKWWFTYTCFGFLSEWTSCTWPLQSCAMPSTTAMSYRCGNMALFLASSSSNIWRLDLTSKTTTSIEYLLCDTIQGHLRHMYKFMCLLKVFLISACKYILLGYLLMNTVWSKFRRHIIPQYIWTAIFGPKKRVCDTYCLNVYHTNYNTVLYMTV